MSALSRPLPPAREPLLVWIYGAISVLYDYEEVGGARGRPSRHPHSGRGSRLFPCAFLLPSWISTRLRPDGVRRRTARPGPSSASAAASVARDTWKPASAAQDPTVPRRSPRACQRPRPIDRRPGARPSQRTGSGARPMRAAHPQSAQVYALNSSGRGSCGDAHEQSPRLGHHGRTSRIVFGTRRVYERPDDVESLERVKAHGPRSSRGAGRTEGARRQP